MVTLVSAAQCDVTTLVNSTFARMGPIVEGFSSCGTHHTSVAFCQGGRPATRGIAVYCCSVVDSCGQRTLAALCLRRKVGSQHGEDKSRPPRACDPSAFCVPVSTGPWPGSKNDLSNLVIPSGWCTHCSGCCSPFLTLMHPCPLRRWLDVKLLPHPHGQDSLSFVLHVSARIPDADCLTA